ncbi:MAG: ATP synthase F1 subunit delta [Bryobacterales bacterium]|nr:ATP synthase F1 subunit delta [Bryobacterales bacterium]
MSLAIASHYANALADVVLNSKGAIQPQTVLEQLKALESTIQGSHDLRNVLSSPAVPMSKKGALVNRICEMLGMDRLVRNFVYIVVRNRRSALLALIRTSFESALDERTGLVKAEVSSAAPLSGDAQAALEAQLANMTGKRVRCHYSVDHALIGGVVASIGSKIYDGSVRGQLEALRRKLTN